MSIQDEPDQDGEGEEEIIESPQEEQTVEIKDVPEEQTINTSTSVTRFKDKPIRYVEIRGSPIDVSAASIFSSGRINIPTKGILDSFTVSVNDPLFKVFCRLRDHENGSRVVSNHTVNDLALEGLGLTTGEMNGDVTLSAFDPVGVRDPIDPYIARGKNQYTGSETVYENLVGSPDDKYLVIKYVPEERLEFSNLEFYIENTNPEGTRRIHKYLVRYFELVDDEIVDPNEHLMPKEIEEDNTIEINLDDDPGAQDIISNIIQENPIVEDEGTLVSEKKANNDLIEEVSDLDTTDINIA